MTKAKREQDIRVIEKMITRIGRNLMDSPKHLRERESNADQREKEALTEALELLRSIAPLKVGIIECPECYGNGHACTRCGGSGETEG